MSSKNPRHSYTGQEKMAILRETLLEKVSISEVCQKHGITPGMFYEWQKKLFDQGAVIFSGPALTAANQRSTAEAKKLAAAEAKIQQKNEVLAELMGEHVALKKNLACSERPLDRSRCPRPDR